MVNELYQLAPENEEQQRPAEMGEPMPLEAVTLPAFDTSIFPDAVEKFVQSLAHYTQTPPDPSAIAALSAVSVAAMKKFEIRANWKEPVNLFAILAHDPANRKSAIVGAYTQMLDEWEQEQRVLLAPEIARSESELKELVKRQNWLIEKASKANKEEDRQDFKRKADALAVEIQAATEERKAYPRPYADDITGEKLAVLMRQHGGKMALLTAEGSGPLRNIAGRYDSNSAHSSMSIYLKSHAGDTVNVDRIGRESFQIIKPALTLCLFLQPETVKGLPGEYDDAGLWARFIYSFPPSYIGQRDLNAAPVPDHVEYSFRSMLHKVLDFDPETPVQLKLNAEANELFLQDCGETEYRLLAPGGEFEQHKMTAWGGKLQGLLLRLIGLIHIMKHADRLPNIPEEVDADTVARVLRIKRYLIQHAKYAYNKINNNDGDELAKYVLKRMDESRQKVEDGVLSFREFQKLCKSKKGVDTVPKFEAVCRNLEEMDYIRLETGQRGKRLIRVNPRFLEDPTRYLSGDTPTRTPSPLPFIPDSSKVGMMGTGGETEVPTANPRGSKMESQDGDMGMSFRGSDKPIIENPDGSGLI